MIFIPNCILKNWHILLFYCKRNGIPLSTNFARPIVCSALAWWWPIAAKACSLIMNWFYYITVLVHWVVVDGNISIKISVDLYWESLFWRWRWYIVRNLTSSLSEYDVSRTEGHDLTAFRLQCLSSQSVKANLSFKVLWEGVRAWRCNSWANIERAKWLVSHSGRFRSG